MQVECSELINAPREIVWRIITDIDSAAERIGAIRAIEVLDRGGEDPRHPLIGLRWRETRVMFGKEASETMTITGAVENDWYETIAHNHGMVYRSRLDLEDAAGGTVLRMGFKGEAQGIGARLMSAVMMPFFKKGTIKALQQDLLDIRQAAEALQHL